MRLKRGFGSDNNSGIHPEIMRAIERANEGHCVAYGDDPFTESAVEAFRSEFGPDIDVYFTFTGTAANVLGLRTACSSYESVLCSDIAHLNEDECGAPENFIGAKLLTSQTADGKIRPEQLEHFLSVFGNEHRAQPKAISITQATELGTVYTPEEIRALADFAHKNGLILHMDGARLANAAASLNLGFRDITAGSGVDILSFGGTKNGMMIGEAVVFFDKKLSGKFKYIRKQGMQLASKMRFISAQFEAYLKNELWLRNARHSNHMAKILAGELSRVPGITITQKVEANGVFVIIPEEHIEELRKEYFFYIYDERGPVARLMTSFDTQEEEIRGFVKALRRLMGIHAT